MATSSPPTLQIVIASTRPGRVGGPVAEWFTERARAHGGFEVEVVDLAEVNLPFLDEPEAASTRRYTKEHSRAWSRTVQRADAFVFVTPEYNHGYTAPLKNALDFLYHEWRDKAAGVVSYGGVSAGTRSFTLLLPVLQALRMAVAVEAVNIPFVGRMVRDGRFEANDVLELAAQRMLDELVRLTTALRPVRPAVEIDAG